MPLIRPSSTHLAFFVLRGAVDLVGRCSNSSVEHNSNTTITLKKKKKKVYTIKLDMYER